MRFQEVLGQEQIKNQLIKSVELDRVAHAHLFVGDEGTGTLPMAIAYASYLLSNSITDPVLKENCNLKCAHFAHPDMHFAFPVTSTDSNKKPISDHFIEPWREFLTNQVYGNLFDWYISLGIENKQGRIAVAEAQEIVKKMSLKAYEGGKKIMIIWRADKMNVEASNKLLKLIEEPPKDTVFILTTQDSEALLATIKSRCQITHFKSIHPEVIEAALKENGALADSAKDIAHRAHGNYNKALDLLNNKSEEQVFARWFVHWIRTAFKAKGNKVAVHDLLMWSNEVAKTGRETQKNFLEYCIRLIRQALLANYTVDSLCHMKVEVPNFDFSKFTPFVHENNILELVSALESAIYHVERNGNSKVILSDLALQLTRLIHKKPSVV